MATSPEKSIVNLIIPLEKIHCKYDYASRKIHCKYDYSSGKSPL